MLPRLPPKGVGQFWGLGLPLGQVVDECLDCGLMLQHLLGRCDVLFLFCNTRTQQSAKVEVAAMLLGSLTTVPARCMISSGPWVPPPPRAAEPYSPRGTAHHKMHLEGFIGLHAGLTKENYQQWRRHGCRMEVQQTCNEVAAN